LQQLENGAKSLDAGVGLVKGLAEVKTRLQGFFGKVWPLMMIVLGVLLMFYRE
jgi:hypothetical protein